MQWLQSRHFSAVYCRILISQQYFNTDNIKIPWKNGQVWTLADRSKVHLCVWTWSFVLSITHHEAQQDRSSSETARPTQPPAVCLIRGFFTQFLNTLLLPCLYWVCVLVLWWPTLFWTSGVELWTFTYKNTITTIKMTIYCIILCYIRVIIIN